MNETILAIAGVIGMSLLTYGLKLVKNFLDVKASETGNNALKISLDLLSDITGTAVSAIEQTLKPTLIEKSQDGKLSKDDMKYLKAQAKDLIKNKITPRLKLDCEDAIRDFDRYMEDLIEAHVLKLKK